VACGFRITSRIAWDYQDARSAKGDVVALREFVDKQGTEWRVWDVTPEGMNPATVRELFLGEFEEGWLAFECATSRRRLARWPRNWAKMSDGELEDLCETASLVTRRSGPFAGERQPGAESSKLEAEGATVPASLTFAGHDGRHWMVTPVMADLGGNTATVLRFTASDGTVLDLEEWPDDWMRFTPLQLADMARRARPPRTPPDEPQPGQPEKRPPR
jgi:hypothetical protein